MSGVILALPDRPVVALSVLAAAGCLADLTSCGRINVLAIRTPPVSTILPSDEVLTEQHEQRVRSMESTRVDALKQIYEGWASGMPASSLTTEWTDIEDLADKLVSEWGRRADFVVLKRPMPRELDQERRAVHAALFETDRPVLLVPPDRPPAPFGRRVAFAWRDDGRTMKAVLSGLRCAANADQIHVLAGMRDPSKPPRLPEVFREHGITAALHVLPITGQRAFGEDLLRMAHQLGADMLVVGAFARHPMRSVLLGGVTRYMLAHADLPLLMRH